MLNVVAAFVVVTGFIGFVTRPYTLLTNFVAVEYLLLGAAAAGAAAGVAADDTDGVTYLLVVLGVAAAESAVGLALLVQFYRLRGDVGTLAYPLVKG